MHVDLRSINKTFGKVHANIDITLDIPAGAIQGILGENGAGKSTLMKILSGFIHADSGGIFLDEKPVHIQSPADAIHHGIGMLHQDPLDFPPMTVLDNFLLGRSGKLIPDRAKIEREFNQLASDFEFSIRPDTYVDSLTVGERQQLEILRLLSLGARVLILDEPTTGISLPQKQKLFATLKKLAAQGMTVILVSHKLEDVEYLCDKIAVLRQGRLVGEARPAYITNQLVEMMFGKQVSFGGRQTIPTGNVVMSVKNLALEDIRLQIRDISLDVHAGEVIGLSGMEGSGQSIFLRACAGLVRPVSGSVWMGGTNLTGKSHHVFKQKGAAYLPAARLEEGLIPGLSLTEHFILAEEMKGLFINHDQALRMARERVQSYNIKGDPYHLIESLSGGNQQRALLSLLRTPLNLILLEHPTRGLDVESTMYIWSRLKERCKQGTAIIFISADLDEILQYSDRILVFFAGKVSPPLDAASTSVEQLGQLIGGKSWDTIQELIHA